MSSKMRGFGLISPVRAILWPLALAVLFITRVNAEDFAYRNFPYAMDLRGEEVKALAIACEYFEQHALSHDETIANFFVTIYRKNPETDYEITFISKSVLDESAWQRSSVIIVIDWRSYAIVSVEGAM